MLDSDNFCNCVDISKLSKEHDYAKARPAISGYTGTDYLSALYRKGNLRPLLLMKENPVIWGCICSFGQSRSIRNYHR